MGAATLSVFTAFPATAIAGSDDDIEMLKQQNAEMKEMMMRMQQQIQELANKANAVEHTEAKKGKKKGRVASKKENIVVSTTGGGIKVKSSNGNKFKIGGSVQLDHDNFDEFWGDAEENEIRRSRLALSGASGRSWSYKFVIDIDHEGEAASVDTGLVQYAAKPFYIRVGKFKRPGMLEARTSSKWVNTIERSIINELAGGVLSKPDFGGISLKYVSQGEGLPMSAELGIYDDELEEDDGDDIFGVGARISVAPQFNDSFLHLGASYYRADYDGNSFRMRSRMGVHTADPPRDMENYILDTQNHLTDDVDQYGLEAAYVAGPFSLQGEYMVVESDGSEEEACGDSAGNDFGTPTCLWHRDMEMDGFYIQVAYTLTGESLGYSPAGGNFSGIRPKGRQGAWELVVQYADASLELPGLGIDASADSLVLGVNWYATRNVKVALNYIDSEVADCEGTASYTPDGGGDPIPANLDDLGSCGTDGVMDGDAYSLRLQYAF